MAVSWASNVNIDNHWDLCEGCQVNKFGGWPKGFVPIKTLSDSNGGNNNTQVDGKPPVAPLPPFATATGNIGSSSENTRQKKPNQPIVILLDSFYPANSLTNKRHHFHPHFLGKIHSWCIIIHS